MNARHPVIRKTLACLVLTVCSSVAWAQSPLGSLPRLTLEEILPTRSNFTTRETLLGDWGGLRPRLEDYGVRFTLNQTSDYVGNTQGGIRQGFVYDGLLDLELDFDLNKAIGWQGGRAHFTGYSLQGQNLTTRFIGSVMTTTNIESDPSIPKVGEFWLEQKLLDKHQLAIRAGLLEADRYYMISPTANVFVNSTFGFPDGWEANMPGSGPSYPNAAPGVLASYNFYQDWKFTASVMSGKPLGPDTNSSLYNTKVSTSSGTLTWVETAFSPLWQLGEQSLQGYYKVGGWYNAYAVSNVTLSESGRTFTNPVNTNYRGQYAVYGLIDQAVWREANSTTQGLNVFGRVTYNPQTDRNLVTWYFDTGLAYIGLFYGRPNDIIGLGFAWAKFTPYLNSQIATQNMLAGTQTPMANAESLVELTYQAPISPWLTLQPFFQVAINPGGKAPMPNNPNQAIPNATVVGLRANVAF